MLLKPFYPVIFGGCIGYLTNWIAIKMLFWPKKPILFLHGAIPKNKEKLAQNIAITSTDHLFSAEEVANIINQKLTPEVFSSVINGLIPHIAENLDSAQTREEVARLIVSKLKNSIGPSFSDGFARGLTQAVSINEFITLNQEHIVQFISNKLQPTIASQAANIVMSVISAEDIQKIIINNVKNMNEDEIEKAIYKISSRELALIEWSGGVLGIIIGLIQMLL